MPSTTTTTFRSPQYRYTATVATAWTIVPAFVHWDGTGSPGHESAYTDRFRVSSDKLIFAFAAPTSAALEAYARRAVDTAASIYGTCPTAQPLTPIDIGAGDGVVTRSSCGGVAIHLAAAVRDGVGYQFILRDQGGRDADDPADVALFAAFLEAVVFPG